MITKNSAVKFQNLIVNHESRLIKSKPVTDLDMLMKQGISSFSRNLVFVTRIELQIVFSTKANLLFLLYLMVLSCQIKQICLMKSFLGILDLMIR